MKIKSLEPVFYFYNEFIKNLCKLLMCAMIVIVSISVIGRFFFNSSPSWGEEGALFCLIWLSTISSALAIVSNTHLRMMLIDIIAPPKFLYALDIFVDMLTFIFGFFLLIKGIHYTQLGTFSLMPALKIKKAWLFACIPITGASMIIFLLDVYLVRGGRKKVNEC